MMAVERILSELRWMLLTLRIILGQRTCGVVACLCGVLADFPAANLTTYVVYILCTNLTRYTIRSTP
jgi:hypothetical protein